MKFQRTWGRHKESKAEYFQTKPSTIERDPAGVALTLSMRLISVVKVKNIVHIESGFVMMALAMALSSEVSDIDGFKELWLNFIILRMVGSFQKQLTT